MNDSTTPLRCCTKCRRFLPATTYYFHRSSCEDDGLKPLCKECRGNHFGVTRPSPTKQTQPRPPSEYKRCKKCERELPATTEYFVRQKTAWMGVSAVCKECRGRSFGYRGTPMPKRDGYKVCTQCHRELPSTIEYFYRWHTTKDGLHRVCKECKGSVFGQPFDALRTTKASREGFKVCGKCGVEKLHSCFDRRKESWDGLSPNCKDCRTAYKANYNIENREKIAERTRRYRLNNPELIRLRKREYYLANRDKVRKRADDWRRANLERVRERVRRSAIKNKGKRNLATVAYHQKRRARKRSLPDNFTADDWQFAIEYFHGCCAVCGRPARDLFGMHTLAADHWIPLSSPDCPGTVATNIVPLCHGIDGCNNRKGSKNSERWLIEIFGARKAKSVLQSIEVFFDRVAKRMA